MARSKGLRKHGDVGDWYGADDERTGRIPYRGHLKKIVMAAASSFPADTMASIFLKES